MSLQDRGISPNPFEKDFQPGKTIKIKRSDFTDPDAFSGIEEMPPQLTSVLSGFAEEKAVQGLAVIIEDDRFYLGVIQNLPEDPVTKARISLHGINLRLLLGADSTWIDMKRKPFEDVEADIRLEVSGKPKAILAAIFRFTD